MKEREQLAVRAPYLTRKLKASGGLAAMTLGDLQGPAREGRKFTKRLCTGDHHWKYSRHTKQCLRCGLEDAR